METTTPHWNKEELFTYTSLYCANADLQEDIYEVADIKSHYPTVHFDIIHKEFENDNDVDRANKIINAAKRLGYSKEDFNEVFSFMNKLIGSDGHVSAEEQMFLHGLHELLNGLA
ncbi:MAG: hypothetical protein H6600_04035 [Flavobacteriales bacterium]|nr:hypothetical protein [Flavobacteriales bacterium]